MLAYIVKRGDTLWQIAKEHQITLDALLAANPQISDPNYIMPGTWINVPRLMHMQSEEVLEETEQYIVPEQGSKMETGQEAFMPPPVSADNICTANNARPCIFITTGGETLHNISEEWNIPLAQLHYHNYQYALNTQLPSGERIIIPMVQDYRVNMDGYGHPRGMRNRRRR